MDMIGKQLYHPRKILKMLNFLYRLCKLKIKVALIWSLVVLHLLSFSETIVINVLFTI